MSWDLIWELFHWSILAALVAGLVAPLVGSFLLVRRTGFYGITLPQFAAAGIAFGFAIQPWFEEHFGAILHPTDMGDELHLALSYHLGWAGSFTLLGLAVMACAARRKDGTETGVMAASFAIASALTLLFSTHSAEGDIFVSSLLKGEILTLDSHEFTVLASCLAVVALLLVGFRRELVQSGYDPDLALVLGRKRMLWEGLLILLIGVTVSAAVMTVGPIVLFGLLVIPPLAARPFARSMDGFLLISSLFGLASAFAGLWICFHYDWPLGPSIVVAAAVTLVPGRMLPRLLGRRC